MIDPYQTIADVVIIQLTAHSIDPGAALEIQRGIVAAIKQRFAGNAVYFKSDKLTKTTETHRQILKEFNGSNHAELMLRYQIGAAWLSKLLKRGCGHGF